MKIYRAVVFHFILLFTFHVSAQERLRIRHGCQWDSPVSKKEEIYVFEPSKDAQKIVESIFKVLTLKSNFILKAANISNALATTENDQRYILYNSTFLENFKKDSKSEWAIYCVLAHEIGHHLNFDNFKVKDPAKRKLMELSADRFAGATLQKMGATIEEAKAGINTFTLEGESNTHPPKSARLEAIINGWNEADDQAFKNEGSDIYIGTKSIPYREEKAEKFYNKGVEAYKEKKIDKAMAYLDEAIKLNNDFADAFDQRGVIKYVLGDHIGANNDYNAAIKINPNEGTVYIHKGLIKYDSLQFDSAFFFYSKAILCDSIKYPSAYYNRGILLEVQKKHPEAISDFDQAIKIKPDYALAYNSRGNAKLIMGSFKEAISDYDNAIKFDSTYAYTYYNKGVANLSLYSFKEANENFDKAIQLMPYHALSYAQKAIASLNLGDYKNALKCAIEAERLDPSMKINEDIIKCKQQALKKLKD